MASMDSSLVTQDSDAGNPGSASKKKALLVRSNAMCGDDDTKSLRPPPQHPSQQALNTASSMPTTMGNIEGGSRMRAKHYSSNASSLSRGSSAVAAVDYTDSTGIHLMQFIINTLHKNAKDREMLLNLELEMRKFVLDNSRQAYKFPKMSSYNRMLVHRVAAFYGLDHNIDQTGTVVVVNKTPSTRVPETEFRSLIKNNMYTDRMLSRRNVQSFDECRLSTLYGNFNPAAVGLAGGNLQQQQQFPYGSATTFEAAGQLGSVATGHHMSTSLDMIRRARSFEVGEWQNSMAGGGGGGMTPSPQMFPLSSSSSRHHRLSGGSTNSNCSINWQQQQQFQQQPGNSPGLPMDNSGVGFVAGGYAPGQLEQFLQQSSLSSSRPESLASLHCRMGGFGSGECVVDGAQFSPQSQARARQLSANSNPAFIGPLLSTFPAPSMEQSSRDSGFDGGAMVKSMGVSSEEPSINHHQQVSGPDDHSDKAGPPGAPLANPTSLMAPLVLQQQGLSHTQWSTNQIDAPSGVGNYPDLANPYTNPYTYGYYQTPTGYVYAAANSPIATSTQFSANFSPVVYTNLPRNYAPAQMMVGTQSGPHYYAYPTAANVAQFQPAEPNHHQHSMQLLANQYQQAMNISADSGTDCSPLNPQQQFSSNTNNPPHSFTQHNQLYRLPYPAPIVGTNPYYPASAPVPPIERMDGEGGTATQTAAVDNRQPIAREQEGTPKQQPKKPSTTSSFSRP